MNNININELYYINDIKEIYYEKSELHYINDLKENYYDKISNTTFYKNKIKENIEKERKIWESIIDIGRIKEEWNNLSKTSLTIGLRLAKTNINDPKYYILINPYKCTVHDINKLKEISKKERFETHMVCVLILLAIVLNFYPQSNTQYLVKFRPFNMIKSIVKDMQKEFKFEDYIKEYNKYLDEFTIGGEDGLRLFMENLGILEYHSKGTIQM